MSVTIGKMLLRFVIKIIILADFDSNSGGIFIGVRSWLRMFSLYFIRFVIEMAIEISKSGFQRCCGISNIEYFSARATRKSRIWRYIIQKRNKEILWDSLFSYFWRKFRQLLKFHSIVHFLFYHLVTYRIGLLPMIEIPVL